MVAALKKIKPPITKEKIINEIEQMQKFDLGGFTINFDPQIRFAFGKQISLIKG